HPLRRRAAHRPGLVGGLAGGAVPRYPDGAGGPADGGAEPAGADAPRPTARSAARPRAAKLRPADGHARPARARRARHRPIPVDRRPRARGAGAGAARAGSRDVRAGGSRAFDTACTESIPGSTIRRKNRRVNRFTASGVGRGDGRAAGISPHRAGGAPSPSRRRAPLTEPAPGYRLTEPSTDYPFTEPASSPRTK